MRHRGVGALTVRHLVYGWLDILFGCRVAWICDRYDKELTR